MEDVICPADILAGTAATGATIIDNDIAVSDGLADLERIGRHARVFIDGMASGGWQLGGLNVYKASTSQPDTGQSIRDLLADLRATAELAVQATGRGATVSIDFADTRQAVDIHAEFDLVDDEAQDPALYDEHQDMLNRLAETLYGRAASGGWLDGVESMSASCRVEPVSAHEQARAFRTLSQQRAA
ncbi:hypothetical protein [Azospirillum himalayense]|uniref:Uncharacterized protein n=1 Tax=Azospirillum himalayense TaxID=654847 RepID=A0ABW0G801_9PROT